MPPIPSANQKVAKSGPPREQHFHLSLLCSTWSAIVEDIQTKNADNMVRLASKLNLPGLESEEGPIKVAALMPIKCKDQVVATPKPSPLCTNITKYHFQLLTRGRYDAVVSVGKAPTLATRTCSVKLHYAKMKYSYQSKKLLKYHVGFRCVHQSCIALVLHRACKLKAQFRSIWIVEVQKTTVYSIDPIAKTNFCGINVENSVTTARSSRQIFWMFFLDAIAV